MKFFPTTLTTEEDSILEVSICPYEEGSSQRLPIEKATHVIEFWHEGGCLCSSYFIETFMAIPDNQGLCLEGNRYEYQSINSDQVTRCKRLIKDFKKSHARKLQTTTSTHHFG